MVSFLLFLQKRSVDEMNIVFEDVKFTRITTVPKESVLQLTIYFTLGQQNFEVIEGGEVIASGKVFDRRDEHVLTDLSVQVTENDDILVNEKDIYKEFRLRGYQYSGKFRNLKRCKLDLSQAEIKRENNWVAFIDCFLELAILREDSREIYLPIGIQQLIIDGPSILKALSTLIVRYRYFLIKMLVLSGLEMKSIALAVVARRRTPNPVLETQKFIANITNLETKNSVRCFLQLILENVNVVKISVVEIVLDHQELRHLLFPAIQEVLNDALSVQQTVTILTDKDMKISGVDVRNTKQPKPNCLLLVTSNLLETINEEEALDAVKDNKGFIISRENPKVDLNKFVNTSYTVLGSHANDLETLVLLRPTLLVKQTIPKRFLDLTNDFSDLQWLPKLQNMLKERSKVIIYAQNELSGILGLVTCLKKEYGADKICCVFTIGNAPKFDPELNFYKNQLEKNLSVNIWKNGSWGTYRYLVLPELGLVQNEHCYVSVATRGDLSTVNWTEGKCSLEDIEAPGNETIYVYYAALNFRDFMTATGRITPDVILKNRVAHEYLQGLEFAGRNSRGERVAGMNSYGSLATITHSDCYYQIPDHWTMEDAVTVNLVYGTLIQIFVRNSNPKPGESILIHSGASGIGLAAINLSLYFGFIIFVTVGTSEKRDFIKKTYPQIEEEHIGNSRDTSFENMIEKYTNGRGVDYVLNSLTEEKLLASARCLAKGGSFCEIGKYDLSKDNVFSLHLLEKDARFVGTSFDTFINFPLNAQYILKQLTKLINCGAIKPLPRTVFSYEDVNKAFRLMGTGNNIGKLIIKVRDEETDQICQVSKELKEATPKFHCTSQSSYVICGGLGGFGLELADFLVLRGARRLALTGRSGLYNGYQHYRIGIWNNYGVKVLISTLDAANEEDCIKLLNLANGLGPVDGIFNLAVVLRDALFENQTAEDFQVPLDSKVHTTENLDRISRQLCPHLRHFVVFSSLSSGLGNAGQSNYGMANSFMERTCEKRKREGYPGMAIQWGNIGEIGLLAKIQGNNGEFGVGGTLQQSVSSCLQVLDKLLKQKEAIVSSKVLAPKKQTDVAENMFDAVVNILGITNLKATNMQSTFPELGMDSMMGIDIKQTLEYEYGVLITAQDIKSLTLSKLKSLSDMEDSDISVPIQQENFPKDAQLLLCLTGDEKTWNIPTITMRGAINPYNNAPYVLTLPGLGGISTILEPLCKCIKGHVVGLQYCPEYNSRCIGELAESIFQHVQLVESEIVILAYSTGCVVAIELLHLLEENGKRSRVIFIDGSPEMIIRSIKSYFPVDNENLFETTLLCLLMAKYMSEEDVLKHKEAMLKCPTYEEKLEYAIRASPKVDLSESHRTNMWKHVYEHLLAALAYKIKGKKFTSLATLVKASTPLVSNLADDYGLSSLFQNPLEVRVIEGNHLTILENNRLCKEINETLESSI